MIFWPTDEKRASASYSQLRFEQRNRMKNPTIREVADFPIYARIFGYGVPE